MREEQDVLMLRRWPTGVVVAAGEGLRADVPGIQAFTCLVDLDQIDAVHVAADRCHIHRR